MHEGRARWAAAPTFQVARKIFAGSTADGEPTK
jgi:hypothetical protein